MTRGPRRLKDDPDFKWETGCDLGDEARLIGDYDLPGLRERLIAAAATSTPPVTVGDGMPAVRPGPAPWKAAARPALGVMAGAVLVASAYWLGVRTGASDQVDEPPAPVEQVEPVQPVQRVEPARETSAPLAPPMGGEIAPAPQGTADGAEAPVIAPGRERPAAGVAEAPAAPHALPLAEPSHAEPPSAETEAVVLPSEPEVSGTSEAPAEAQGRPQPDHERSTPSGLYAYQKAFEEARAALVNGRYAEARERFEGLLERWPEGQLGPETELGLLQALHGIGDAESTLGQAEKLQHLPAFDRYDEEIARLRAESLVLLGRCEEALLVAEQLSVRGAAEIRRICRQQRKESP